MIETFFTEKRIIKKIIIVLVFIFMFNFTFSYLGNNVVFATDGSAETMKSENIELSDGGGKLLLPIHQFVLWVADAILELMQHSFFSSEDIIQRAKSKDLSNFDIGAGVLCIVCVIIAAVAVVYTAGAAASIPAAISAASAEAAAAGTSAVVAGLSTVGTIAGQIGRRSYSSNWSRNCCI